MKNTPLTALAIFLLSPAIAQYSLTFDVTPDWSPDGEILWFDQADYDDGSLVYTAKEKIVTSLNSASAILDVQETAVLTGSQLWELDRSLIGPDFQVKAEVKQARSENYLVATVIPFRKNSSTGQIEKLISGELAVNLSTERRKKERTWRTAASSALSEGTWYKIALERDGIYRIDKGFLEGMGINTNSLNPQNINIYGNGGEQLPFSNAEFRYDDLQANRIFISGEADESFDNPDYILFYGKGADSWDYDADAADPRLIHHKHHYSDSAYYFIRIDDVSAVRIQDQQQAEGPVVLEVNSFLDRQYLENDNVNLLKSGREFLGEVFSNTLNYNFNFPFQNVELDSPATLCYRLGSASVGAGSSFEVACSGAATTESISPIGISSTASVVRMAQSCLSFTPGQENIGVNITYDPSNPSATGYLDYLAVNARRALSQTGNQMHFRDTTLLAAGEVAEWRLSSASGVSEIWDVTDVTDAKRIVFDPPEGAAEITFRQTMDEMREYISFANGGFFTPRAVGPVSNQDLHGWSNVDMVIVTSPLLFTYAEEVAQMHIDEGLTVELTTPMKVYNEFSSGNPDVTAIKMLMKHLYDEADGNLDLQPQYLLMFGDGSYKGNKSVNAINSYNLITYQNNNVSSPTGSYVSDDYFAFLDDNESEASSDLLDIGVGRIPASSADYAAGYLNKMRLYTSQNTSPGGDAYCLGDASLSTYGPWRNIIAFVADDQDGNGNPTEDEHMTHSDEHADSIYTKYNDYNVVKLYMDAYQQESTPGGERYPNGEEAIRQRVQNGALIVNYIGHGGEKGWAHERILDISAIKSWTNLNRLPVFMTATCELSRYDDPDFESAGELTLMNPNGGAIAMLTTTRIVFSGSNQQLGEQFYNIALEDSAYAGNLRLGDIARITKNEGPNSSNTRNFSLLGDPAMKIAYPLQKVFTTHMNDVEISAELDTVRSLQVVNVRGYVGDHEGNILSDFDGFVYPTVYDKQSEIQTLNNDGGVDYTFDAFQNIIYKGKASVEGGLFEFNFVVPRDINYTYGSGRISYYAVAGSKDAHGHFEGFTIGGSPDADGTVLNTVGPEVELFMNDSTFVFGGLTDEEPILFAKVFDENGINTVGNGIGHDLKATLDGENASSIILNDFYEADLDTYQSGEIRYQLTELSEGIHNLTLKVWDVHNNSAEAYTEFVVAEDAEVALDHVLNYPNPFTTRTEFMFEHNQACEFLEVMIEVYTVSGRLVKTLRETVETAGFRANPIPWDGKDEFGDKIGRGVYVYRIHVRTPDGKTAEQLEKLVVLN